MAVQRLVETFPAVQYDGSNAQEIVDAIEQSFREFYQIVIESETGGTATFAYNDGINDRHLTINTGDWMPVGTLDGKGFAPVATGGLGPYAVVQGSQL